MTKTKATDPKLNMFGRFKAVWTNPNFIGSILLAEGERATPRTWGFWFGINSVAALLLTAGVAWFGGKAMTQAFENEIWPQVPEFELTVKDGKLSTNLPEPYVFYEDEEALVVVDTQEVQYTEKALQNYEQGAFINAEKFVARKDNGEYRSFYFSEFEEDFTFTRADLEHFWNEKQSGFYAAALALLFVLVWFWLCVLRLVSALWWALLFWGIGTLAGVKGWSFGKSYLAVLNFYVIPLTFEMLLLLGGLTMPFSTIFVFGLVFGVNFWSTKPRVSGSKK